MTKSDRPKFSVIMVDFEGSVSREIFRRGVECFGRQTFQDFELLIYHDGPKSQSYELDLEGCRLPKNIKSFETPKRENNWGHGNRNRGIYEATGDWIIHTNADNVFYETGLADLAEAIDEENWALTPSNRMTTDWDVIVFPIIMRGYSALRDYFVRKEQYDDRLSIILPGVPVELYRIDAMQFVMKRKLWLKFGGWSDTSETSDGKLYQKFAQKTSVFQLTSVIAEHW